MHAVPFTMQKEIEKSKTNSGSFGLEWFQTQGMGQKGGCETSWLLFDGHDDWNGAGAEVPLSGVTAWEGMYYSDSWVCFTATDLLLMSIRSCTPFYFKRNHAEYEEKFESWMPCIFGHSVLITRIKSEWFESKINNFLKIQFIIYLVGAVLPTDWRWPIGTNFNIKMRFRNFMRFGNFWWGQRWELWSGKRRVSKW